MKEKIEKPKSSITVKELMDYVEEQLEKHKFSPDDMDKIINGVWAEKTSCTVRQHLAFDGIRGTRIIHYEVADAFYELLKLMQENDLTFQDLKCDTGLPELLHPELIFSISTKEHEYTYYPVILYSHFDSDEYVQIKNGIAHLQAVYCNPNYKL